MPHLIKPTIEYKDSFIASVSEFQAEGRNPDYNISELKEDFAAFVAKLNDKARGLGLKEGYAPETVFWLVDKGEYIGRISIRHRLPEKCKVGEHIGYEIRPTRRKLGYGSLILELALPIVTEIGIRKIRIACNENNVASARIIKKNGGVFQDKIEIDGKSIRRYLIDIQDDNRKLYTLTIVHQEDKILLGMKKRGFGEGRWNGFGGKVMPEEGIAEAAKRELEEEAGIKVSNLEELGIIDFEFRGKPGILEVHIFKARDYSGEVRETEEMKPQWFNVSEIPFNEMWSDDIYWMPLFLEDRKFKAKFLFDENDQVIEKELNIQ